MADKTLKSTIQVDMDTRGVAKGVAATNRELEKLNKSAGRTATATSITAAINVAQTTMAALQGMLGAVNKRMDELDATSVKFSGSAMAARASADMARMEADIAIANAVAPGSIEKSRALADLAGGEAARVQRNAGAISAGIGATARFGGNLMSGVDILTEGGGAALAALEQIIRGGGIMSEAGRAGFGQLFDAGAFTLGELGNAQNYAYQAQGSARGMDYDDTMMERQTRALENIDRKLGGP